jgi:hypothetical protein
MTITDGETGNLPQVALRPPGVVMRLARLGAFHQTRISFTRTLIRRMQREAWAVTRERFDLDDEGYGAAVYAIETPMGRVSFVAFANRLDPADRTDRVIAERWDAAFCLCDGAVSDAHIEDLRTNVPLQEAGRLGARQIVLSRANKSVRLFASVVDSLARGEQPTAAEIGRVGYLMRTTAVYGNGKFGMADLAQVQRATPFVLPYQAEMLTVYMIRHFTLELVDHIAARRGGGVAATLSRPLRHALGIGNATGLGMAPFLVAHPRLVDRWILARETAIARVRAVERATPETIARFTALLARAVAHVAQWSTDDERQMERIGVLRRELAGVDEVMRGDARAFLPKRRPWDFLVRWAEDKLSLETGELLISLMLELYPELVEELENATGSDERMAVSPGMALGDLKALIERDYDWALGVDYQTPDAQHYFWYRSEEKDEPRLGERWEEPGGEIEMRIGVARDVAALHAELAGLDDGALREPVAAFLLAHPRWRHMVRRVQSLAGRGYAEIRDNLLAADCLPIDILRCKLAIFGASKFDPKSDRWTRIALFQGAPLVDELGDPACDDWAFPVIPG